MKTKLLSLAKTIFIVSLLFTGTRVYSQINVSTNLHIKNITYPTCSSLEFEVWLEFTGDASVKFQFLQAGIIFNYAGMSNGGTITGKFVSGSADPSLPAAQQSPIWIINQTSKQIRMLASIANPSSIASILPPPPGIRVGIFHMQNTLDFTMGSTPDFSFNNSVSTTTTTQTRIGLYVNGNDFGTDVTNSSHDIVESNPAGCGELTCAVIASIQSMTPPTCFGLSNGKVVIFLSGSGVTLNGTYTVDDEPSENFTSNPFTVDGLSPGLHSITIFVNNGCTASLSFEVISPPNPDDNNACTIDACNTATGAITHTPVNTSDNDACTTDGCNPQTGVSHIPFIIDDGNACTSDACITTTGTVTHILVNPSDNNPCTTDGCNAITGVFHIPISVNDGNACTIDACNSQNGSISHTPINLSDGNFCTVDACDPISGSIFHTPVNVNDNNPCTNDVCNSLLGVSHFPILVNDGNECTTDFCSTVFGVYHLYTNIDDNNACTIDACNPSTGVTTHTPVNVNDNNQCTIDFCDGLTGFIYHFFVNIDDGNPCTVDGCDQENGLYHYPVNVDDENPCTIDICLPNGNTAHLATYPIVTVLPGAIACYGGTTCVEVIAGGSFPPYSGVGQFCEYGAGQYTFDVTDSRGCLVTATVTVTQPLKLNLNVTSTDEGCGMSDGTATVSVTGGTPPYNFLWSPGGQFTPHITGLSAGLYGVTATDNNGCIASSSANVGYAEGPPSTPEIISGSGGVCRKQSGVVYCIPPQSNASSYEWILPPGATVIGATNGSCITLRFSGRYIGGFLCVRAVNGCGTSGTSCKRINVVISPPPTPGVISGPTTLCSDETAKYSIQNVPTAVGYNWTVSSGLILVSGQGTTSIIVKAKSAFFHWNTVRVRAFNCKGNSSYRSLSVLSGIFCREANKGPAKENTKALSRTNQNLTIYPNPAIDKFNVEFNSDYSGKSTIHLTDITGRILITENIDVVEGNNRVEFDAGGLTKGMYLISIQNESGERRVMNIILE